MGGLESFRCVCRICRSYDLSLNWHEELDEFIRMSYKDCFYKYTQYKETGGDPLSQFLCEDCATGVKNFHLLVEKSLETFELCEQQLASVKRSSSDFANEVCSTSSSLHDKSRVPKKQCPKINCNEFSEDLTLQQEETYIPIEYSIKSSGNYDVSLEESKVIGYVNKIENTIIARNEKYDCGELELLCSSPKSFLDDNQMNENPEQNDELTNLETASGMVEINSAAEKLTPTTLGDNTTKEEYNSTDNIHKIECIEFVESDTILCEENEQNILQINSDTVQTKHDTLSDGKGASNANHILLDYDDIQPSKVAKTPVMCSYCSKIVHNIYYLKLHEQTHEENRPREVSCPTCGIKLFNKQALYVHKKTHDKNRIKKFKCEFCDKAFFNRGACNVHRRIHLGQMTQCPLCPKQFYRQVELDRHMPSHSHESLNSSNRAKPKKYYVHCKECDKKVLSDRFNAHRAVHMNDPFMRCTVCEKDFFSRKSGGKHMSCVHKRKAGNYDDITFYYKNKNRPRLSFLIMRQQEDVEPVA